MALLLLGLFLGVVLNGFRDVVFQSQRIRIELLRDALKQVNDACFAFESMWLTESKINTLRNLNLETPEADDSVGRISSTSKFASDAIGNLLACGYEGAAEDVQVFRSSTFKLLEALLLGLKEEESNRRWAEFLVHLKLSRERIIKRISRDIHEEGKLWFAIKRYWNG